MIDLKTFCKQNNISPCGKKPIVIKRILQHFENEEKKKEKEKEGGKDEKGGEKEGGKDKE